MKYQRQETFYITLVGFAETYLPKPAAVVRPVRAIRVYCRDEVFADPYTFTPLNKVADLNLVRFTFRDGQDRELLKDIPARALYSTSQHAQRKLADLPIDPQRSSAILSNGGKVDLAVEFIYAN